ncbi:MAG: LacI family DNA-binding transcriptional regulator [Pseudomonadota bacterium]
MKKRNQNPNLAEIAEAAGVSKMTASRVLRDAGGFSEDTRDKVLREAERLNYVPNRLAAAFGSDAASTLIGVLVPRLSGGLFGDVVEGIDRTLSRFGYQTMIGTYENEPEAEEDWLRAVLSWRPAGLILTGRRRSPATNAMLATATIPVVEIWELNTRPLDVSVGVNHYDCGYEMGRLLISRGRRRIGFVGAEAHGRGMGKVRSDGFAAALADAGLTEMGREILRDKPGFYAGSYGTETLLIRHPTLDAIYFQDDEMAVGGLSYLRSRGLSAPEDIGVAGWGGMDAATTLARRLTTTAVSSNGLGKRAAEAMVARIRGEPVDDVIEIPARLIPGATG